MAKEYFPLFFDFNETTSALSDAECGRLVRAIVHYINGEEYALDGIERVLFPFFKGIADRNAAISEARANAVSKRYNKENTADDATNSTNVYKTLQNAQNDTNSLNKNNNKKQKTITKNNNDHFERFWTEYPRKVSKANALKAFNKINPDEDLLTVMIDALKRQRVSPQWTKDGGQFIPHPATWLNGRRWEDEITNGSGYDGFENNSGTNEGTRSAKYGHLAG